MGKIRNKSGEARDVPFFGTVQADEVLEVPDDVLYSFSRQGIWEPVDKASQAVHDKAESAEKRLIKKITESAGG